MEPNQPSRRGTQVGAPGEAGRRHRHSIPGMSQAPAIQEICSDLDDHVSACQVHRCPHVVCIMSSRGQQDVYNARVLDLWSYKRSVITDSQDNMAHWIQCMNEQSWET